MNKLFPNKRHEYLIKYGWQNIQGSHRLMAHNKREALKEFNKWYGVKFDYIEVERY